MSQIFDAENEQDQAALLDRLKRINADPEADLSLEDKVRISFERGRREAQKRVDRMIAKSLT